MRRSATPVARSPAPLIRIGGCMASRMESSRLAEKINISGDTYHYVQYLFDCEYRGKIAAKNKGHIDMYLVNGIKKELRNEKGYPNSDFFEKMRV